MCVQADRDGAPLSPQHTHFVFVDNGKENSAAWGGETHSRAPRSRAPLAVL